MPAGSVGSTIVMMKTLQFCTLTRLPPPILAIIRSVRGPGVSRHSSHSPE